MEGRTAASWLHALLPERLWISRCFVWDNPTPTKTYYSAGPFVGAASIPMGRGFLIYNGMMSTDFGTSPSEYSDTLLAQYASIFTLDTVRRLVRAKVVEYPTQVLNELKRDLSDELPKLVETIPKREREVQKHVNTVLGLRYKDLDFRWEQFEFPYSIKSYKPDFISERASIAIDVKLCKKEARARGLVDEINADITAYKTHFGWILFLVYDTDKWIEDPMSFTGDFERHNAGVLVSVVTHRHKQK